MERLTTTLEDIFVDIAMAEGQESPSLTEEIDEAAEAFECSLIDVAFAEAGDFTVTACVPHHC